MRIDEELKQLLAAELCAVWDGNQYHVAAMLRIHQPDVSALRRGQLAGFSVQRLIRLIADRRYNVEVTFRQLPRPVLGAPRASPTVTVQRYDSQGQLRPRPPWPILNAKPDRGSGEVEVGAIRRAVRLWDARETGDDCEDDG